jgi:hypothetical protein
VLAAAAHYSSSRSFGLTSVAYSAYLLVLGANRAASLELGLVTGYASESRPDLLSYQLTGSLVISTIGAATVGVIAIVLASGVMSYLLVVAMFLVPLILQDHARYRAISAGRAAQAIAVDATWLLLFCAFLVIRTMFGASTGLELLAVWCACGSASTVVVLRRGWRTSPSVSVARHVARDHRGLIRGYLVEYVLAIGVAQMTIVGIAALAAPEVAGSWRVALTYFGPVTVLNGALLILSTRRFSLERTTAARLMLRRHLTLSLPLVALTVAWAALGAGPLSPLLGQLFGESWSSAQKMILWLGLAYGVGVFVTIGRAAARAERRPASGIVGVFLFVGCGSLFSLLVAWTGGSAGSVALAYLAGSLLGALAWCALLYHPRAVGGARSSMQDHAC